MRTVVKKVERLGLRPASECTAVLWPLYSFVLASTAQFKNVFTQHRPNAIHELTSQYSYSNKDSFKTRNSLLREEMFAT